MVAGLGLDLVHFKHVITPLTGRLLEEHPDSAYLQMLKNTCRNLIIDGPNCVIGCLPDNTLFMVQDRKKLRPGIAGGMEKTFVFASETCGLDAFLPDRDRSRDFQPMHLDTIMVPSDRQGLLVARQTDTLHLPN